MSRKKLWFYTLLGIMAFTVTLAIVAPPLAVVPVGFTVLYMPGLAFSLLLAWAVSDVRFSRPLVVLASCSVYFTGFLVMGSVLAAFTALVITLAVYSAHKRTNRSKVKPRQPWPVEEPATFVYPTVRMSYSLPVAPDVAARQVH